MILGGERKPSWYLQIAKRNLTEGLSEAWRYTGPFTRYNRFKGALPGLGTATVAFAVYCTYEYFFMSEDHHGLEGGHGGEHH